MKRIFFIFLLHCFFVYFAQKGGFSETNLFLGTNFIKDETTTTLINLDIGAGYAFSEKFRIGLILPVGFIFFRNEHNAKSQSFAFGLGFVGNFRFFTNEKITLRSDTRLVMCSPSSETLSDWVFGRIGTEIQVYFNSLTTEKNKALYSRRN